MNERNDKKWKQLPNYPIDPIAGEKIKIAQQFIASLVAHGIHYNYCIKHKEVLGCSEAREYYKRFSYYIGEEGNYCICKNILLQERKGAKRKFLIIISDDQQIDLAALREELSLAKLEFLSKEKMEEFLHTTPGNVSLFSLANDKENAFEVMLDQDLLQEKQLAFHPLYNGMSLFLKPSEAIKFVDAIKHPYQVVAIPHKEKTFTKKRTY